MSEPHPFGSRKCEGLGFQLGSCCFGFCVSFATFAEKRTDFRRPFWTQWAARNDETTPFGSRISPMLTSKILVDECLRLRFFNHHALTATDSLCPQSLLVMSD